MFSPESEQPHQEAALLMTTKFSTRASPAVEPTLERVTSKDPAATALTLAM
jgi:hypothetical protein